MGLVEEIQKDALDQTVKVSTLLRKVKLAAAKLRLPAVQSWVEFELTGYESNVPEYRRLTGDPRAYNPYNGTWIPIAGDPKLHAIISSAPTGQPIAELEALLETPTGQLAMPLSQTQVREINRLLDVQFHEMAVHVGRPQILSIVDRVRTMVLDWSIDLEAAGIKGEGLTFSDKEQRIAQAGNITIHNSGTLAGNFGSGNSSHAVSASSTFNASYLQGVGQKILNHERELIADGADERTLRPSVELLLDEVRKPSPDQGKLRSAIADIRSALSGAAGNLIAEGAMKMLGAS